MIDRLLPNLEIKSLKQIPVTDLVPVHLDAFQGFNNVRLGRIYSTQFLRWFFGYSETIGFVAELNGELVGYVFGAPVGYSKQMSKALLPYAILGILTHPWLIINHSIILVSIKKIRALLLNNYHASSKTDLPLPTLSLVGIGVRNSYQGRGVGKLLLQIYRDAAVEKGFSSLRLSVHKSNMRARQLYERSGWILFEHPSDPRLVYYGLKLMS
jgi:ribosomal protein S18 acetylase RimI-like enzyme